MTCPDKKDCLTGGTGLNVAMVQAEILWRDVPGNLARFEGSLEQVGVTDMIILPEMFTSGFSMQGKEETAAAYERIKAWMERMAMRKNALVIGSTVYGEGGLYYNRLLGAYPNGGCAVYDKRHCFTMGEERAHFTPGRKREIFTFKGIRIAPFVCYDLRFPVWSRNTDGYDLAVYVANWPETRRDPWQILLKARAVENQAYVVGVNRVGRDGNGLDYSGDSMAVSPRGEVLAACTAGQPEICRVNLDMQALETFRKKFPVLADRDDFELCEGKNYEVHPG